jgi:hypothetical protein
VQQIALKFQALYGKRARISRESAYLFALYYPNPPIDRRLNGTETRRPEHVAAG